MGLDILAVNLKTCSVFDFLREGETKEELLKRAYKYKEEEVELLQNRCWEYPKDDGFRKLLESTKKYEFKVVTFDEFQAMERRFYLDRPVKKVSEKVYLDMLNVLPPLNWCTIDGVEMFCMREMYTGTYTSQYAKYRGQYYTKLVDVMDKSTWLHNYIK